MMGDFDSQVKDHVKSLMSYLSTEKIDEIVAAVRRAGADTEEELCWLTDADLESVLPPVKAKILLNAWQKCSELLVNGLLISMPSYHSVVT